MTPVDGIVEDLCEASHFGVLCMRPSSRKAHLFLGVTTTWITKLRQVRICKRQESPHQPEVDARIYDISAKTVLRFDMLKRRRITFGHLS